MSSVSGRVLPMAKVMLGLNIARLVICVLVIALAGYGLSGLTLLGAILSLVAALVTIGTAIWELVTTQKVNKHYNYWAVLALEIFLVVFWLVAMSLYAANAAAIFDGGDDYFYCYYYYGCDEFGPTLAYGNTQAAGAGLSGVMLLLCIATLVISSIGVARMRRSSGFDNSVHMNGMAGQDYNHDKDHAITSTPV